MGNGSNEMVQAKWFKRNKTKNGSKDKGKEKGKGKGKDKDKDKENIGVINSGTGRGMAW